ncbi:hypothetical protein CAPTEDRAFT_225413 [Capitella teleta]|uniref:DUF1736 domain-containing protein n=1 Tax=Capitella teleta TaxID=283909 RepID=R7T7X8_CAPTE|nr:hypothetical protein CAPTEDRAFT_225413 [Capitella teleta]|eukprot:ELT89553.1 hypothetical protein CAPTEDRAFT_225413 [Capitella teleta]
MDSAYLVALFLPPNWVTGVVGRAELLSSIFYLGAFLVYTTCTGRHSQTNWSRLLVTIAMVTVAMLCKEQGITIIAVCCVYEVFVAQQMTVNDLLLHIRNILSGRPKLPSWLLQAVVRALVLVCGTLMLLMARVRVMGAQLPVFTRFDNPAAVAESPSRQLTLNYLLPVNAWLLLCPSRLCCDWTMGTLPLVTSILDPRNLATVAFFAVLGRLVWFVVTHRGHHMQAIVMTFGERVHGIASISQEAISEYWRSEVRREQRTGEQAHPSLSDSNYLEGTEPLHLRLETQAAPHPCF